jgi:predicted PurR-regulated permease PerM
MHEPATIEERVVVRTNFATGVIAFGVIVAICYYAGAVIQAVLVSIILAIFLDPIVELLRRIRFPRPLGAFIALLLLGGVVLLGSFALYNRVQDFAQELPVYSRIIRGTVLNVRRRIERFEKQTEQVIPPIPQSGQRITVTEAPLASLFPGFQTATNILLIAGFVPFFVFFMLSWKEHLNRSFLAAFAEPNRSGIQNGIRSIATAMRSYLVGNILVGFVLSGASMLLFFALSLRYAIVMGLISGFISLVPYVGVVLAMVAPVVVALPQYHTAAPYVILISCLAAFHIFALNVLFPKIVGRRVDLNPVAVTLALFVWGWMWGAMGMLLAIPITAGAKAICDNVQGLRKYGQMLGD